MSKPDRDPENMKVVEIDALDPREWQHSMKTSVVPVAGLEALVRQSAEQPATADPRPSERGGTQVAQVAPPTTARPSPTPGGPEPAPAPPPEAASAPTSVDAADTERHVQRLGSGFAVTPKVLLLFGAIAVGITIAGVLLARRSTPTLALAPTRDHLPNAPRRTAAAPAPSPATSTATEPVSRPATAPPPPTGTSNAEPAVEIVSPKPDAPKANAAQQPEAVDRMRPDQQTVATRSAPQTPSSTVDVVERARAAYAAGNKALFDGDSDAAIRAYLQVLELSPTFAFGRRGLGLAYAQKGDNAAAIKALREYLRIAPDAKDVSLIRKRIRSLQSAQR